MHTVVDITQTVFILLLLQNTTVNTESRESLKSKKIFTVSVHRGKTTRTLANIQKGKTFFIL
jgi:hypothetical protein